MKLTKRITALFLTMVILLSGVVGVAAEELYTLSDVTNVLKYTAGWGDEYRKNSYDYNSDGMINLYDATCIIKVIAGWDKDSIILKKPTDEYIKELEEQLTYYHRDDIHDDTEYGITYKVYVAQYYGTYNGADVVLYYCPGMGYEDALWTATVAGYKFYYTDGNSIKVWKDGEVYSLGQAYVDGILTKANIKKIAEINLGRFPYDPEDLD